MKNTLKIFTLFAAVLCLTGCGPDDEPGTGGNSISYIVSSCTAPASPVTATYDTDAELDVLLDRLCSYAERGKVITFRSNGGRSKSYTTKESTTFSTTSREEMKRWMAAMEDAGKTVTVTYDSRTFTWNGRAYALPQQPMAEDGPRVSRVTFDYSFDSTETIGLEQHVVYTYTWDGDLLTAVETEEKTWCQYADGSTGDTTVYSSRQQLAYNGNLCVSAGSTRYTYLDGLLVSEWLGYDNVSYTYIYDDEGHIIDYIITDTVTDFGVDVEVSMPGYHIEWENGDAVRAYGDDRQSPMWIYEYDNFQRPRGVTLGITTLLPGYQQFFEPLTQWSRHNITLLHFNGNDNSWIDLTVTYTYDNAGRPVSATLPRWHDGGHGHWTFEYVD